MIWGGGWPAAFSKSDNLTPNDSSYVVVTVKKGDTLYSLAKRHHTTPETVAKLNGIENPAYIRIGQQIKFPAGTDASVRKQSLPEAPKAQNEPAIEEKRTNGENDIPVFARGQYLGTFTLTAYTAGPESTGKRPGDPGYGITSSGSPAIEGLTIAVDPSIISTGSRVYIEGLGYRVAQDTGGMIKGRRIDVFMSDVEEAKRFGVKRDVRVELVE